MDESTPYSDEPADFRPNAAEKALGYLGTVTVAPLLIPVLPLVSFLQWAASPSAQRSGTKKVLKNTLVPVAAGALILAFIIVCIAAIPSGALYALFRLLGIVRKPPADQLEDEPQNTPPP